MYRRYYRKEYPFTYAVYFNCSFSCVNRMSTFYSRLEFLLYRVDNIFRSTELPLSSWYVWHKWSNCWSPCSSTHALTLAHLSTWCPIFLLAHQNCDACSVRRVCQWITMHPFSQQTAPPPSSPSEVKHKYCCLLWKQPWQNILTSYLFLALVFSRECFSLLYLRPPKKPRPFWGGIGWHCVWGNNGYYVPNKIYAAAHSTKTSPLCNDCLLSQPY